MKPVRMRMGWKQSRPDVGYEDFRFSIVDCQFTGGELSETQDGKREKERGKLRHFQFPIPDLRFPRDELKK